MQVQQPVDIVGIDKFEIVTTSTGAVSIRNNIVNEIMHNPVGPWAEANSLYVMQPRLVDRFESSDAEEFVIFDVGLGAASNAVAALHALSMSPALSKRKRLRLVSFENDLSLLDFALMHSEKFHYYQDFRPALESILTNHFWQNDARTITWELRAGDFPALIGEKVPAPSVVFYDPYSPSVNPEMWSFKTFKDLHKVCCLSLNGCTLYTYSIATRVRAAMLAAGFYVGYGLPTGLKEETTQAATKSHLLDSPLGDRWMTRWMRSHASLPLDVSLEESPNFVLSLTSHAQFQNCHSLSQ